MLRNCRGDWCDRGRTFRYLNVIQTRAGRTQKFPTVTSLNGLCCSTVFVLRTGECYPRQNLKLHILKCLLILIPNHKKSVTNLFLQISYTFRNCFTQNDIMDNHDQISKHTEVRTVMSNQEKKWLRAVL